MTRTEARKLLSTIVAIWPRVEQPDNAPAVWQVVFDAVPYEAADAALKEWIAEGHAWPPSASELLAKVTERETDVPDFEEAWRETLKLIPRVHSHETPIPDQFSHPVIAAWAIPAWKELRMGPAEGVNGFGTHYAQQREAYRAIAGRLKRGVSLALVGAPRRSQVEGGGLKRPAWEVYAGDYRRYLPERAESHE